MSEPQPSNGHIERISEMSGTIPVDSMLNSLTLDEKIGQLFSVPAYGSFTNEHDPGFLRLKRLIRDYHIGGIIFFRGDVYGQAILHNKLQRTAKLPLWVSQDMEFGAAMRVEGTTRFTPAMGVAATGNPENAYLKGKITAREAKALGVHQIYAPVLDVNNNPDNPVINVRSFSADPDLVALFGMNMIEGIESEGILATAKHFPGHGDTDVDSHLNLPVINHGITRLEEIELVPFRKAVNNGLRSVMSAHIAYPNVSTNGNLPGTLDESILRSLLIDELGFNGLVVTDGLEMQGIAANFSPGEAVVLALKAGADKMLISPDEMTAIHELKRAVQSGTISEERIDRSVRKILSLKAEHGLFENRMVNTDDLSYTIDTPEYRAISERIARESVTLLKNDGNVLPVRDVDYLNVLAVALSDDQSGSTGSGWARELRKYHNNVSFHVLDRRTSEEEIDEMRKDAMKADLIIIGSFIVVRSSQPMQIQPEQLEIINELTAGETPSVLMAFGNPYVVRDVPDADVHLMAWSASRSQIDQTVPALFGASHITGQLPIRIPGMYEIGDGIEMRQSTLRYDTPEAVGMSGDSLLAIDMIMQEAINDSVFPGGVVAVMHKGALVWNNGYGYYDYSKTKEISANEVYDLASLTKVVATTTSIMKLVDEGLIGLDDPVQQYIPEFSEGIKKNVTIRHLLLHTSGLPAFKVYVDELQTRDEIISAVRREPLISDPGEEYEYSDLGFILLGEIVEQVSGRRLDRYVRTEMFYPMGMYSTHFNPSAVGGWMSNRIPPTEIDTVYERGLVQGVVHDERAYYMEGVAGHAGLFSTARDLAVYSYMLLNGGLYAGERYLSDSVINEFTEQRSELSNRGFGFDRKSSGFSTAGSLSGPNTFGHTGFTGTSIWIDPDRETAIILLTNRVHPNRSYGSGIGEVRAKVADTVLGSIVSDKEQSL
ncbi:glycoside hydrolase family 3 N-terminal domain-containing protein [Rhodohalobacter mucosus]|uniref:glycoside hydrolase family 3 N-terminal domain-containing protein n=1 Tax=Rhodohalobacter mucosus TaxID=2079485 RepID=UPI001304AD00|nr:glycoside hydrolase family 3 N-terminal domain-containing protein [Rhodohalobacter mucosus]